MEEKNIALIERLLAGKLTPEETLDLERKAQQDPEFEQTLKQMKQLIPGIQYSGRNRVLADLKSFERKLPPISEEAIKAAQSNKASRTVKLIPTRWYASIAAAFLAIAVFTFIMNNQLGKADHQTLYVTYFQPYPNLINPRTRTGQEKEMKAVREKAALAYEDGKYQEAINLIASMPSESKEPVMTLYEATAHLALDNTALAIVLLEPLAFNQGEFAIQATWYLALARLKAGNEEEAKKLLEIVTDSDHNFAKKAKALLEQL